MVINLGIKKTGLILNPTENIIMDYLDDNKEKEGFYISDDERNIDSKVIFAGRSQYTEEFKLYKKKWCDILKSTDIDFRCLSGLHAHIITFMSIGNIGDTVLLLPEIAGGHFSTEKILHRLGFDVVLAEPDLNNYCINKDKTINLIKKHNPKFAFIDRSEGLYYEDFSWISSTNIPYLVFDASQYLTQILCGTYTSPFDMGFNLILSTLHKNYPGPQKAILATKALDYYWKKITSGSAVYISNSHPRDMFIAGQSINNYTRLKKYNSEMMEVSISLEEYLYNNKIPVVRKKDNLIPTQHIWITFKSKEECYSTYQNLEKIGVYTNYRLLPYNLGVGLRLGVGGAIQAGLRKENIYELSEIITQCYRFGYSENLKSRVDRLIELISYNGKII